MAQIAEWLEKKGYLDRDNWEKLQKKSWRNIGAHLGGVYPDQNHVELLLMFLERNDIATEKLTQVILGWLSEQDSCYSPAADQLFNEFGELNDDDQAWKVWLYLGGVISQSLGITDCPEVRENIIDKDGQEAGGELLRRSKILIQLLKAVPENHKEHFLVGIGYIGYCFSE